MEDIRRAWATSKAFRIILVVILIYAALRLAMHVGMLGMRMLPGQSVEQFAPNDLQDYTNAALRLQNREPLYLRTGHMEYYQYPPAFALAFTPFLWIPEIPSVILQFLLRLVCYGLLYFAWGRIFQRAKLKSAVEAWAWTLPVWLVFSAFWSDLAYMNIYLLVTLFATLFIEAVLNEDLSWAVLWFTVLCQTKPHWAFALGVPFLLWRWRFFWRLLAAGIIANAVAIGAFLLITGPVYGWQQHVEFVRFLADMRSLFPWRIPADGFLGYNHSITQVVVFLAGLSAGSLRLATIIKVILLLPLLVVGGRYLLQPVKRAGLKVPQVALGLAFALYLGVFIWMDMVWEVSLGIAIFPFLLGILENRAAKIAAWAVFLPYALVDFWQLLSYIVGGDAIFTPNGYILTDPTIYVPWIMVVILVFYGLLLWRLWKALPAWTVSRN